MGMVSLITLGVINDHRKKVQLKTKIVAGKVLQDFNKVCHFIKSNIVENSFFIKSYVLMSYASNIHKNR